MQYDTSYVTIDLDAIDANFERTRQKAGVPVLAIVKADAYGFGVVPLARHLESRCAFFGVANIMEALELRRAGIRLPILILGYTPIEAFPEAIEKGIRPAIFRYEDALALSEAAQKTGQTAPFHFAVDTGMSRIGFQVSEEEADLCAKITALPGLYAEGMFSHFATADCTDLSRAEAQAQRFNAFISLLDARGVRIPYCHLNNSAGLMNFSEQYDLVRAGVVLHGLYPSGEVSPERMTLNPALSWHSRITFLKTLPAGREIGYGGTYTTTAPTRVATIPVGYADGYRRGLTGKFYVLIHGKRAPILGRVCMDQIMVDVTAIPEAAHGDPVVLIGRDGKETITVEQIAEASGMVHYEFLCGIQRRVPRYYIKDGKVVQTVHYLSAEPISDIQE